MSEIFFENKLNSDFSFFDNILLFFFLKRERKKYFEIFQDLQLKRKKEWEEKPAGADVITAFPFIIFQPTFFIDEFLERKSENKSKFSQVQIFKIASERILIS